MERFGRYVLLERIAAGGMAEVFRAASLGTAGFSKPLAIKRILPHLVSDEAMTTMLIDEAKIAASLSHPNILQVLDLGEVNSQFFIAMEFVAGKSLNLVIATALKQGLRLPLPFCAYVMAQAVHGLAYAHQKVGTNGEPMNIIHRDVSPQNIMVGYDGAVKLADFGIAKAADRHTHTRTGTVKGKLAYMAPEQAEDLAIDQRVDIFAMGVVAHELFAMRRLRKAKTDVALVKEVVDAHFPRFEELGLEVPDAVAQVIYRALEKDRNRRWPDAHNFAMALEGAIAASGWHFGTAQVGALMRELFAEEVAREREAQQHFDGVMMELHASGGAGLSESTRVDWEELEKTRRHGQVGMTPLPAPPAGGLRPMPVSNQVPATDVVMPQSTSRRTLVAAAVLGLAALSAVALGITTRRPPSENPLPRLGNVVVETEPEGATVLVSGKEQAARAPVVLRDLLPGPVEVEARMEGRLPSRQIVVVGAGETQKLRIVLAAAEVQVPISSEPAGATVRLGDAVVGRTPTTVNLRSGTTATLKVELAGYATVAQELVAERAPARLHFSLVGQAPAPAPTGSRRTERHRPERTAAAAAPSSDEPGKLSIQSSPWARIYIDGKDLGRFTPLAEYAIAAGTHEVKLVNPDEKVSATFKVEVPAGRTVSVSRTLR
ncbi:MAG: serine/threonine-protein kinase [Myxococcota bacterium]